MKAVLLAALLLAGCQTEWGSTPPTVPREMELVHRAFSGTQTWTLCDRGHRLYVRYHGIAVVPNAADCPQVTGGER